MKAACCGGRSRLRRDVRCSRDVCIPLGWYLLSHTALDCSVRDNSLEKEKYKLLFKFAVK